VFVLVALSSVAVLTAAALLGTGRGLAAAQSAERQQAAASVAAAAATAYAQAGGWRGARLDGAVASAAGAGARLIVRDQDGSVVSAERHGPGMPGGGGPMGGMAGGSRAEAPVLVDGTAVGSVQLTFARSAGAAARDIAWIWIALAAVVALAVALTASWFVSSRIAGPLVRLAATARAISAGDRSARSGIRAPGEIGELASAFDTMADEVTRTEQTRRNLTADVAHELRTPLATLQAGLEELRDGYVPADAGRLTSLHDQALRLGRVVEDLAALSAAESAALALRPADIDLAEHAGRVLAAHDAQLRAAGMQVRTELAGGVVVRADPDRLHQALGNLLDNAARYGRPGDQVTVRVHAEDGYALAEVADTGPGIPADELPHVFERLWRGRSGSAVPGSGIGLAVVRELVAAHGGSVTAESGPAGGTTFTIRLPTPT
jgi:two-component system sensor histidine kinase BaeS